MSTCAKAPKACDVCGKEFAPVRSNQKVCGPECRKVAARKREHEYDRKRYAESTVYRDRQIAKSGERWAIDHAYREAESLRRKSNRAKDREARRREVVCPECQAAFVTDLKNRARCGPECRRKAANRENAKRMDDRYHRDPEFRRKASEYRQNLRITNPKAYRNWMVAIANCKAKRRHREKLAVVAAEMSAVLIAINTPKEKV